MTTLRFKNPVPTAIGREYWNHCNEHRLAAQQCSACGNLRRYLTPVCPRCASTDYTWRTLSGYGTVYTYTVSYRALTDEWRDEMPIVVALVDLEEGIRQMANIVETPLERVTEGLAVEVVWERRSDTITVPQFRPRQSAPPRPAS